MDKRYVPSKMNEWSVYMMICVRVHETVEKWPKINHAVSKMQIPSCKMQVSKYMYMTLFAVSQSTPFYAFVD